MYDFAAAFNFFLLAAGLMAVSAFVPKRWFRRGALGLFLFAVFAVVVSLWAAKAFYRVPDSRDPNLVGNWQTQNPPEFEFHNAFTFEQNGRVILYRKRRESDDFVGTGRGVWGTSDGVLYIKYMAVDYYSTPTAEYHFDPKTGKIAMGAGLFSRQKPLMLRRVEDIKVSATF